MTNEEFHDALYRERCRREVVEGDNRRLREALENTLSVISRQISPHYITELDELREAVALLKTPNAALTGAAHKD